MSATIRNAAPDSYMQLVAAFPLRRITSVAGHIKATRIVLRLSSQPSDRGMRDYLDVLVDLITDLERREGQAINTSDVSAAEVVRHRIDQRGMSISSLARLIGVPQSNLSEMLNGKRDWSKSVIRGLCMHLNIRAERFLA